jgi:hypothetical protein
MERWPKDGIAEVNQELKCYIDGREKFDIQWFVVKDDGKEEPIVTDDDQESSPSSIRAEDEDATYRCRLDGGRYADFFVVQKDELDTQHLLPFRVDKFEKSYSVIEQEDLKVECKISNRTSELDIKEEIEIKWYEYNITGDENSFITAIGNCSEDVQSSLNWHEVKINSLESEPHIRMITLNGLEKAILKIEDANRTTDRRAYKCVAYMKNARSNCSESVFFVRVRDRYAALWPFVGIVVEVVVICFVIFVCERRRASAALKEEAEEEEEEDVNGKTTAGPGNSNVRQRTSSRT